MTNEIVDKLYSLQISDIVDFDINVENIIDFINNQTSYDYYCKKCEGIKSFIQSSDYLRNYVLITEKELTFDGFISKFISKVSMKNEIEYSDYIYKKLFLSSAKSDELQRISKSLELTKDSTIYIFKKFHCPKCNECITMIFLINNGKLEKIYQSFITNLLSNEAIKKYGKSKLLNKEDQENLGKASKAKNFGLNIGAFAYLRRVFENMLERLYKSNKTKIELKDGETFGRLLMQDKARYLKPYLPQIVTSGENQGKYTEIFKLISEGIHNLSDEKCGALYNILEEIILTLLEKEQEAKVREDRMKELTKNYNDIFNVPQENKDTKKR